MICYKTLIVVHSNLKLLLSLIEDFQGFGWVPDRSVLGCIMLYSYSTVGCTQSYCIQEYGSDFICARPEPVGVKRNPLQSPTITMILYYLYIIYRKLEMVSWEIKVNIQYNNAANSGKL